MALAGSEACGAAEVAYGAAKEAAGLVMTATVGASGVGVALFEDGTQIRRFLSQFVLVLIRRLTL